MKKKVYTLLFALAVILLLSSCAHKHKFGEWETLKEAGCTENGERARECKCGEVERETIPAAHKEPEVLNAGVEPTCTKWGATDKIYCNACETLYQETEFLEPIGHSYTDGVCANCDRQSIDFTDVSIYNSSEGPMFFETYENGEAMQSLYDEMEKVLTEFHYSSDTDAEYYKTSPAGVDLYRVAQFNLEDFGVNRDEGASVFTLFREDHPAFYWIDYTLYISDITMSVVTTDDYAKAADRAEYNEKLYSGFADYYALADGETSAYNIALIYYDAILNNNKYSFDAEGKSNTELWAHSVMGSFDYGEFVCEGFSRLFQALLNISGVPCRYVSGDAGGAHSWNMAQMDNGEWYWFDLTFGDGVEDRYKYFCVTDDEMSTHVTDPQNELGIEFMFTLPDSASSEFEDKRIIELGEKFSIDGCVYQLSEYGKVKLVGGDHTGDKLLYCGVVYDVVR